MLKNIFTPYFAWENVDAFSLFQRHTLLIENAPSLYWKELWKSTRSGLSSASPTWEAWACPGTFQSLVSSPVKGTGDNIHLLTLLGGPQRSCTCTYTQSLDHSRPGRRRHPLAPQTSWEVIRQNQPRTKRVQLNPITWDHLVRR